MFNITKKVTQSLILAVTLFSCGPNIQTIDAKGSRSSSSSSRSFSSSRSSSSWGSKSTTPSTSTRSTSQRSTGSSSWSNKSTGSKAQAAARPTSSTQISRARYQRAQSSGKAFTSRSAAVQDFKSRNQGQYTSSYASKPSTRPDHIPQTTSVGGNTYNVTYNQDRGGYGYTNALGTWIMYDMFTDAIMMNSMMDRQGYYVGQPPVVREATGAERFMGWVSVVIILVIVGCFVYFIFFSSKL